MAHVQYVTYALTMIVLTRWYFSHLFVSYIYMHRSPRHKHLRIELGLKALDTFNHIYEVLTLCMATVWSVTDAPIVFVLHCRNYKTRSFKLLIPRSPCQKCLSIELGLNVLCTWHLQPLALTAHSMHGPCTICHICIDNDRFDSLIFFTPVT